MTLVSTKLASHGNDHVLPPAPHTPLPTLIIKQPRHLPAWKTNKTKVSSYFGLFFYLLSFLPFYVKSPQQAGAGAGGRSDTHMCPSLSGPISKAAGQFETCAKRQKWQKMKKRKKGSWLSVPLSELLFVARVRDLLNLWNYFTCISDSRSVCSNPPPPFTSLPLPPPMLTASTTFCAVHLVNSCGCHCAIPTPYLFRIYIPCGLAKLLRNFICGWRGEEKAESGGCLTKKCHK